MTDLFCNIEISGRARADDREKMYPPLKSIAELVVFQVSKCLNKSIIHHTVNSFLSVVSPSR